MYNFDPIVAGSLDIGQTKALERLNLSVEPSHLLFGLIENPGSLCHKNLKKIQQAVLKKIEALPTADKETYRPEDLKISTDLSQWITRASARAIQAGRKSIGEADLLAFLQEVCGEFDELSGIDIFVAAEASEEEMPEFLTDLNALAANGKLDPVIGRAAEIRAVMEILGRRRKNNPVLVGDAGVGKTAVVEGLAGLMAKGDVPESLQGRTLLSLDMGGLMAGTKYRGEFEERMQKLVKYIKAQAGNVILFIDEIHQLVGAGKTEGAMDAANLLKPALARGELHCIGATTHDEYRKYILSDSALDRRFREVIVNQPTEEDAIEIMMGLKDKFEIHHGIEISDEAIFSSVFLSNQYINDKNLPDKAIDLIDEAAAALKLSAQAMPPELVALEAEIRAKRIFAKTEKADNDLAQQIAQLQQDFDQKKKSWEKDVLAIKRVQELKNNLEQLQFEFDKAQQEGRYEDASKIKFSQIPALEKELTDNQSAWRLGKTDVAKVISRQTGIPVEKILGTRQEHILDLESHLKSRVFGQTVPLKDIADTLVAAHAGLSDPSRPLGSFLLLGPSGVGKTETTKALAQHLFDSEDQIVRLDLSEFSEKHAVAKLIGAPAGYVGYEDGGILTEAVRRKPYAIILCDEVEKAHPDFTDILLQILDDGRLTDNKGRTVSFLNTVILMTSNSKNIHQDFKPELLGRLDAILEYEALKPDVMMQLVEREIGVLNQRLANRKTSVIVTDSAKKVLAAKGFDPRFGARPLKGIFAQLITRPLSKLLLEKCSTPECAGDGTPKYTRYKVDCDSDAKLTIALER